MTTYTTTARVRHDDDFHWQEWVQELYDCLTACGLVQTADSGQLAVSPVVAVRPPTDNTDGGYWIFRFNDSLQSTAPIFLKFWIGSSFSTALNAYPRLRVEMGTGTDGSGGLTGLTTTITSTNGSTTIIGFTNCITDTAYPSYFCHTEGFFGMIWKGGSSGGNPVNGMFTMSRTVDAAGNPTADGAIAFWGSGSATINKAQAFRFSGIPEAFTANIGNAAGAPCFVPQVPTQSAVGGDFQAYLAFTIMPRVTPVIGICGVYTSEVPFGTTFPATLVGTAPHTYLAAHINCMAAIPIGQYVAVAMLWE